MSQANTFVMKSPMRRAWGYFVGGLDVASAELFFCIDKRTRRPYIYDHVVDFWRIYRAPE